MISGHSGTTLRFVGDVSWLDDDEQRAWRTLMLVHSRLVAKLDLELQASHGVSHADFEVLATLADAPTESLRMAELAERLLLSPSGLTRRLDGLVRDGLVERRAFPSDRRGSLAVLTKQGRALLEEATPAHVRSVRRYMIEPLQRGQLLELIEALDSIGHTLDEPKRDPAPLHERQRDELPDPIREPA